MYDITKGLSYLHKSDPPIIHRDIRVSNVLLGGDGNYKICNFGNCTKKSYSMITEDELGRIQSDINNHTRVEYRAPEQLDLHAGFPINEKVDVW